MLEDPFRGSAAVAAGRTTKARLRGPGYVRLFPDVYVRAGSASPDLVVRSVAAARLVEGRGVLGGWSAAALLGAAGTPRDAPAEVVVRDEQRTLPGLLVRRDAVPSTEICTAYGCLVTTPLRTAYDLARRLPLTWAVVAVDALARVGMFAPAELLRRREPGARGGRCLDRVVALADPRAVLGGLPEPEVQYELRDARRRLVARFDLAYPAVRLAIEYDGSGHDMFGQRGLGYDDRRRDTRTGVLGWRTIRLTAADLGPRSAATLAAIRTHLTPTPT